MHLPLMIGGMESVKKKKGMYHINQMKKNSEKPSKVRIRRPIENLLDSQAHAIY